MSYGNLAWKEVRMKKWIKVEEQLPPLDEWVLVWLDEDDLHNITHWQPIDRPEQAADALKEAGE